LRSKSPITHTSWKTVGWFSRATASGSAAIRISRNSISGALVPIAGVIVRSSNIDARGDGMAELRVDHLSLRFGGLVVLDDVSLTARSGQLLALIGPNGAGKTSVLNCISGIYRGTGEIRLDGEKISGLPPHKIVSLGIARTFQHGELFPHMSVIDNLLVGRHTRVRTSFLSELLFLPRASEEEIRQREAVERVLDFVELERHRYAAVSALPFGTQKIV